MATASQCPHVLRKLAALDRVSVHLILLAAQICFASLPVVGRLAMQGRIPPASIVLARVTGGAVVFALIAWRRRVLRIGRRDLAAMVGCSVIGVAANQELFVQGLARSTATNASVIGATIPIFTALVAIVLGREPVRARRLVGMAIAFTGVAVLAGVDQVSTSSAHLLGSAMILVNSLCYGTYLIVVRPLADRYDPLGLIAWLFIAAVPMVVPLGIVELAAAPPLRASDAAYFAFLIAVPTVAAYGLVQIALRRAQATLVAAYIYVQPVVAAIGATILLDEQLGARTGICGLVVLAGVWLAARAT